MTGLSDDQRSNFQLMKALGAYTRQEPKKRTETLIKFSQRIQSQPEIRTDLAAWGLEFSSELESFKGRVLPPGGWGVGGIIVTNMTLQWLLLWTCLVINLPCRFFPPNFEC